MPNLSVNAYKAQQREGVILSDNGCIRQSNADSKYGSIYLSSTVYTTSGNGVYHENKRVGHLRVPMSLAIALDPQVGENIQPKLEAMLGSAHTIKMEESTIPFREGQTPKTRGEGGAIITDDSGAPIYHEYVVVPVAQAGDVLVERTREGAAAPAVATPEAGEI